MSTIEGGMICTDDAAVYEQLRMLRSHGMVRDWKRRFPEDLDRSVS